MLVPLSLSPPIDDEIVYEEVNTDYPEPGCYVCAYAYPRMEHERQREALSQSRAHP